MKAPRDFHDGFGRASVLRRAVPAWSGGRGFHWLQGLALIVASARLAEGATIVWSDAGTAFTTGSNWIGNTAPANNLTADIASFGTVTNQPTLSTGNRSVGGLTFTSTSVVTLSGTSTLKTGASGIDNSSTSGLKTISLALNVGADQTYSNSGSLTISGNVALANDLTLAGTGVDGLISGVISGGSKLFKSGTGTWILSGTNTYSGITTISQGTLQLNANAPNNANGALGKASTAVVINDASTGANDTALLIGSSGVSVGRALTVANSGTGTTTLGGNISSGTGSFTGNIALGRTTNLSAGGTSNITFSTGVLSGAGGITKVGTGTVTLSGTNTFTGAVTLTQGTLSIGGDRGLGAVPGAATPDLVVFNGGTLETSATFTLNANRGMTVNANGGTIDVNSGTTLTYSGILAGSGTLTKADSGTLVFGGTTTNTHTGDINIAAGTLQIAKTVADRGIGDTSGVTIASGATLLFSGGVGEAIGSLAGAGTVNNSNAAAITLTTGGNNTATDFSGILQNTGGALSLVKVGTGTQTLSGSSSNTSTGTTAVNNGTLNLNKGSGAIALGSGAITVGDGVGASGTANIVLLASGQLATSAAVTLNADGRLALNDFTSSINTVAGTGLIDLATSGYLTVGANNGSSSFSGSITGAGTLEKAGSGTLTFNSNIDFVGSLTLSGGTLALNGTTLTVGTLHITGNTVLDFGNSSASTLNATTFIIDAGASLSITNWVNLTDFFYTQNWTGATPDASGNTPMNRITFSGSAASDTHWQSYDKQITPVPEAAAFGATLGGAALTVVLWRRRRLAVSA